MRHNKCCETSEVYELLVKVFGVRHINKFSHHKLRDECVRAIINCLDEYEISCIQLDERGQ